MKYPASKRRPKDGMMTTALTPADINLADDLCRALAQPAFRPYAETDLIGVEIGGAVKNVLAIAAGIVAGRRLGASASAALIARSFTELRRLGDALGARPETLMGLSGLGDLILTFLRPRRSTTTGASWTSPRRQPTCRTRQAVSRSIAKSLRARRIK